MVACVTGSFINYMPNSECNLNIHFGWITKQLDGFLVDLTFYRFGKFYIRRFR